MLHECTNLDIRADDELCNLICLYRTPSQIIEEFEMFVKNLELNLELIFTKNPYLTVVIGDFTVKSNNWYKGDKIRPQLAGLNLRPQLLIMDLFK